MKLQGSRPCAKRKCSYQIRASETLQRVGDTRIMYSNYFRYVCEDCGIRESCDRGAISKIRAFHAAHPGHKTHINDFTRPGPTLEEFLNEIDRDVNRREFHQKFIKLVTFGLYGETREDRWRKYRKRKAEYG